MDKQGNKRYWTITYGCQMNEADSEKINGQLEELGYLPGREMDEADIVILNTCSVRQNAEEKVYGKIGEIKPLKDCRMHGAGKPPQADSAHADY